MRSPRRASQVFVLLLLGALAGCAPPGGGQRDVKLEGPPKDGRYLGVAVLASSAKLVKSEQVFASLRHQGARVDFYLVNLTDTDWTATVSFPGVGEREICRTPASNISRVALPAWHDATAKCILNGEAIDAYCDSAYPSADKGATKALCYIDYRITFESPGKTTILDPRLEIER